VRITEELLKWKSSGSGLENREFLATDPEVPDSIPGATRFSEK
jgi:hypothetical protein